MIAIDTNVLLRYLLEDDKSQAKKATALITDENQVLVTVVFPTKSRHLTYTEGPL